MHTAHMSVHLTRKGYNFQHLFGMFLLREGVNGKVVFFKSFVERKVFWEVCLEKEGFGKSLFRGKVFS